MNATIKKLMEKRLNTVTPAIAVVFENMAYVPVLGTPYARCFFLPAPTGNPSYGGPPALKREVGVMQVSLNYPPNAGAQNALAQAKLIRDQFARGLTLTESLVRVLMDTHPYNGPGIPTTDWYMLPVSVPYTADVYE